MPRLPKLLIGVIFLTVTLTGLSLIFPIFRFKQLECQLDGQACPEELFDQLESLKGKSFFFTNVMTQVGQLNLPFYELASYQQTWPKTLILSFTTQPTNYWLQLDTGETYLISNQGLATPMALNDLGYVFQVKNWSVPLSNQQVTPPLHQVLIALHLGLQTQDLHPTDIKVLSADEIILEFDNKLTAYASQAELTKQLAKLKIIMTELDLTTIDLAINQLDLRFNLPVLSRQ